MFSFLNALFVSGCLFIQNSPASIHPVGATEIDQHNEAGERPGAHIGEAEHRQRVDEPEDGDNPQNAEGADAEPNDDDRADSVTGTAQNSG